MACRGLSIEADAGGIDLEAHTRTGCTTDFHKGSAHCRAASSIGCHEFLKPRASAKLDPIDCRRVEGETTVLGGPCLATRRGTKRTRCKQGTRRPVGGGSRTSIEGVNSIWHHQAISTKPITSMSKSKIFLFLYIHYWPFCYSQCYLFVLCCIFIFHYRLKTRLLPI